MSESSKEGRASLGKARRVVVKIGSSLLTDEGRGLNRTALDGWVDELGALVGRGVKLLLVTSGAVASGMQRLGVKQRPHSLHELQAMAAVGQMGLVQAYESSFQRHGLQTAQVLLTHEDLASRERYLNARSTLRTLLDLAWCQLLMRTTRLPPTKFVLVITIPWPRWSPIWSRPMR